jgi:hypothetical protein
MKLGRARLSVFEGADYIKVHEQTEDEAFAFGIMGRNCPDGSGR